MKEGVGDTRTGERSGGLEVLEICLAVEEWRRMVSRLPNCGGEAGVTQSLRIAFSGGARPRCGMRESENEVVA